MRIVLTVLALAAVAGALTADAAGYLPAVGPAALRFRVVAPNVAFRAVKAPVPEIAATDPKGAADVLAPADSLADLLALSNAAPETITVVSPESTPSDFNASMNGTPVATPVSGPIDPLTPQMMMHYFQEDAPGTVRALAVPMTFVPPVPLTLPSKAVLVPNSP